MPGTKVTHCTLRTHGGHAPRVCNVGRIGACRPVREGHADMQAVMRQRKIRGKDAHKMQDTHKKQNMQTPDAAHTQAKRPDARCCNHTGHPSPTLPGQHGCNNGATSTHMHLCRGMGGPGLSPGKCKTCPQLGGNVQERGKHSSPPMQGGQAGRLWNTMVCPVGPAGPPRQQGGDKHMQTPSHAKNHTSNHHKTRLPLHSPAAGRAK